MYDQVCIHLYREEVEDQSHDHKNMIVQLGDGTIILGYIRPIVDIISSISLAKTIIGREIQLERDGVSFGGRGQKYMLMHACQSRRLVRRFQRCQQRKEQRDRNMTTHECLLLKKSRPKLESAEQTRSFRFLIPSASAFDLVHAANLSAKLKNNCLIIVAQGQVVIDLLFYVCQVYVCSPEVTKELEREQQNDDSYVREIRANRDLAP